MKWLEKLFLNYSEGKVQACVSCMCLSFQLHLYKTSAVISIDSCGVSPHFTVNFSFYLIEYTIALLYNSFSELIITALCIQYRLFKIQHMG